MKDVVIVGGGIAGMSAAWRLRGLDTLVLESADRLGGRIRSERRGLYFLNWGGHVFAGGQSRTQELLDETGTGSTEITGSLAGISMNGKLLLKGRVETYPLRLPLPLTARLALLRAGAKTGLDVLRYARVVKARPGETAEERQQRIYEFENGRSFAEYMGHLPEDAWAMFRPTVSRSAGDPHEISAGAGIGYFSLVWNIGQGLSRSIMGGPSSIVENIAAQVGESVQLGAEVHEVVHHADHVVVRYRQDGEDHEVAARTAVLAVPAPQALEVGVDLPEEQRAALAQVEYGSYVSAAFLTNETTEQVWDGAYGIATPKRSFAVALNMGNVVRGRETSRQPGGSLMAFAPAGLSRALLPLSDEEILRIYLEDLDEVLPGFSGYVQEAHVQRWHIGAPYCFPGRAKLQPALTRASGRVFLAGDYLGTLYTETAISSGFTAAQRVRDITGSPDADASPTERAA